MADKKARPSALAAFDFLISLDTEFVRNSPYATDPERDGENRVLSYQVSIFNPRTGRRGSIMFEPDGPSRRHRYYLSGLIGRALHVAEAAGYCDTPTGRLRQPRNANDRLRIALVIHFSRADLPGFRDFKKLKTRFDAVRGTYATTSRPAIFDVSLPNRTRRKVSVTLFDTRLMAPAGYGALKKLGEALGFPKLEVPAVTDETGRRVPGITRMDLVKERHPLDFEQYAIRDTQVPIEWLLHVEAAHARWGVPGISPTIGSFAVKYALSGREALFSPVLGRELTPKGRVSRDPLPEALSIQTIAADAFHGGRNECHAVGAFGPEDIGGRHFTDFDEQGAYTTALAHFRAIDWAAIEHTKDIERLAVCDPLTFATVDFEFPPEVQFPSLPVDAGDYGLIFPRRGTATTIGPELLVAKNQGAQLIVRAGVRLNWLDENGPRPFLQMTMGVNAARASVTKGSTLELLFKEAGNSVFGKVAQGVSAMKSAPVLRKVFNTRRGASEPLGPSTITAAHLAAYTSGLPRACLSEIIANMPGANVATHPEAMGRARAILLSCTTDGLLSSMTADEAEAATRGPVARHFSKLRELVSPTNSPEVLELKHTAKRVLSFKTRGNFTIELGPDPSPGKPTKHLCARAGHRLDAPIEDKAAEVAEWLRIYAARAFDTKMHGNVFVSLRQQYEANSDLIDIYHPSRCNFDFDLKRRPIAPADGPEGLIKFFSEPWGDVTEAIEWREDFDAWRMTARATLKTAADWQRFLAWRENKRTRSAALRTPFQQWLVVAAAHGRLAPLKGRGRPGDGEGAMALNALASLLTDAGVPGVTRDVLRKARARETLQETPPRLLPEDFPVLKRLQNKLGLELDFGLEILASKSRAHAATSDYHLQMGQAPMQRDKALISNDIHPKAVENQKNGPNSVEGTSSLAHLNTPPKRAPEPPATAPAGGPLDASDRRQLAHIRARFKAETGIGRAALELAERRLPPDYPGGPLGRELGAMVHALGAKRRIPPPEAWGLVQRLAAETMEV